MHLLCLILLTAPLVRANQPSFVFDPSALQKSGQRILEEVSALIQQEQQQQQHHQQQQHLELSDAEKELGGRIGLVGGDLNVAPVPGSPWARPQLQPGNSFSQQPQKHGQTLGPDCYCSEQRQCPHNPGYDGSGEIDIRIVNRHPKPNPHTGSSNSQLTCRADQEICCPPSRPNLCPSAPLARTCGERTIMPVPGYQLKPTDAAFGAYPWMSTVMQSNDVYVASAVLVDPQWVMTVAHRVTNYVNNAHNMKVRFGEWDASDPHHEPCPYQERRVVQVIIHQNFNLQNLHHDIALLRLEAPVDMQTAPHINTACLAGSGQTFSRQQCWLAGFGKNAFGSGGNYSYILQEVDLRVVPSGRCERQLRRTSLGRNFQLDRYSFICAGGEEGKDACEGDGGAPLICYSDQGWTVAGLVAWGVGCAEYNTPGVYTNVASYWRWIRQNTGYV